MGNEMGGIAGTRQENISRICSYGCSIQGAIEGVLCRPAGKIALQLERSGGFLSALIFFTQWGSKKNPTFRNKWPDEILQFVRMRPFMAVTTKVWYTLIRDLIKLTDSLGNGINYKCGDRFMQIEYGLKEVSD